MSTDTCMVSIIVAAYNAADYIADCLDSVLAQTMGEWEVIVVEDHGTDDTVGIVQAYVDRDRRFRLARTSRNSGPSAARNIGLALARGKWLAVLDSDDSYTPQRLERMIAHAEANGSDVVSDNLLIVSASDQVGVRMFAAPSMQKAHRLEPEEFILGNISKREEPRVAFGYMKPVMRRQFIRDHDLRYDEAMRLSEDFMLYIAALQHGARWDYVPEVMYRYTVRDDSLASASGLPKPDELRRLFEFSRDLKQSPMARSDPGTERAARLYFERVRRWTSYGSLVQYLKQGKLVDIVSLFVRTPDAIGDVVAEAAVQAPLVARKVARKIPGLSALAR